MVEWGLQPEQMQYAQEALGLAVLAMAFGKSVRLEGKRRQAGFCDCCGNYVGVQGLQAHHRHPESLGGSGSIENLVGVCQDCHTQLDEEAFAGEIYPQVHTKDKYYPQGNGL